MNDIPLLSPVEKQSFNVISGVPVIPRVNGLPKGNDRLETESRCPMDHTWARAPRAKAWTGMSISDPEAAEHGAKRFPKNDAQVG